MRTGTLSFFQLFLAFWSRWGHAFALCPLAPHRKQIQFAEGPSAGGVTAAGVVVFGLLQQSDARCPGLPQLKQLEVCGQLPDGFAVLCFTFFCSWDGDSTMAHCWSRSRISSAVVGCTVSKNATPSLGRSFLRNGRAMATRHCSAVLQSSSNHVESLRGSLTHCILRRQ